MPAEGRLWPSGDDDDDDIDGDSDDEDGDGGDIKNYRETTMCWFVANNT